MKIIVDAFGGDNAPLEVLKGCEMAVSEYALEILLVGNERIIRSVAEQNNINLRGMEIIDAPDVLLMEDEAGDVLKKKKNSSMAQGLRLLADGQGDAFLSAGNSGALVVGATFIVKRIRGIKRCAFAPLLPKDHGFFMLIDSGANVDCRPEMLQQFGMMGSIYMSKVMNIKNPRVGLANIGTEEHKGGELQHEAFRLLKGSPLNFVGNVEAREITADAADVVVTDGFTGNMILKTFEGVAMTLMSKFKGILTQNLKTKLAGAMISSEMRALKKQIDYNEFGGAPIMGIAKPVFKAHGNATAKTFKNALRLTAAYVRGNVVNEISQALLETKEVSDKNEVKTK